MASFRGEQAQRFLQDGISVIETMAVVAILGVLLGLAAPSFQRTILVNRLLGNANQLLTAIHQGRGEALKRNTVVKMCPLGPSETEANCAAPGGNDWSFGWLVYLDGDDDGVPDAAEDVLAVHHEPRPRIGIGLQGAGEDVVFRPNGLVVGAHTGAPPRWELCLPDSASEPSLERRGRMIVINVIGRAETVKSHAALLAQGFSCAA